MKRHSEERKKNLIMETKEFMIMQDVLLTMWLKCLYSYLNQERKNCCLQCGTYMVEISSSCGPIIFKNYSMIGVIIFRIDVCPLFNVGLVMIHESCHFLLVEN